MCPDCKARRDMMRDALLNARIGEAVGHAAKGAAEAAGLKKKSGAKELQQTQRPKRLLVND